jgi:hypothetical protein
VLEEYITKLILTLDTSNLIKYEVNKYTRLPKCKVNVEYFYFKVKKI